MDRENKIMSKLMVVVDIAFVMVLCFVVLLITMFVQNSNQMDFSNGYYIEIVSFVLMFACLGAFLVFLEKRSKKELHECQELAYEEGKEE